MNGLFFLTKEKEMPQWDELYMYYKTTVKSTLEET